MVVRWTNEAKTIGQIVRMRDWPGLPAAPVVEGTIRVGAACKESK